MADPAEPEELTSVDARPGRDLDLLSLGLAVFFLSLIAIVAGLLLLPALT